MLRNALIRMGGSKTARSLVTRTSLRAMSRRFVPGQGVEDLIPALRKAHLGGLGTTANYLGESVEEEAQARHAADVYVHLLDRLVAEGLADR